jgi:hypothetical protein
MRAKIKYFSEKEIQFIKDNRDKMSVAEMGRILNRRCTVISCKCRRIGLTMKTHKLYSTEEESFIRKNHGKMSQNTIAEILNRNSDSISAKSRRMGYAPLINYQVWKPEELNYIKENIGFIGYKQMALHLNRTESSVRSQCRHLKLSLFNNIYTVSILCKELGIKRNRLWYMITKNYLKPKHAPWTGQYGKRPIIFNENAVQVAMKKAPHLFNLYKIENPFFKNMLREVING